MTFSIWEKITRYYPHSSVPTSNLMLDECMRTDEKVSEEFGIRALYLDNPKMDSSIYEIIDEKKYLEFLLKFS